MPAPQDLHRSEADGQVLIAVGATVLFSYACDDAGLRNLAAVTLPEMGFTGRRVAQVLGITEEYVSMLRARARTWRAAGQTTLAVPAVGEPVVTEPVVTEPDDTATTHPDPEPAAGGPVAGFAGSARVGVGTYSCRYAGAMLLYPYLHRVGAEAIFATLTGGPARRYGDLPVLTTATLGFASGVDTVKGTKHLRRAEAGAAVGLAMVPQLATWSPT